MLNLDVFVDALEDEVAKYGVLAVDLKRLAPGADVPESPGVRRSGVLIEMLRVWMEHRWQAGHPVSVDDCLNEFPNESFSEEDLKGLQFEEQRLRRTSQRSVGSGSSNLSIDPLPKDGDRWGDFDLLAVLGEGAFAKVYLARQNGMAGRLVALKLTFRQTHESHWLATLQHSAIVPIYSTHRVGEVNGICMPFLGNTTLADLLLEGSSVTALHQSNWWSTSKRKSQRGGGALLSTIQQRHGQIDTIVDAMAADAAETKTTESNTRHVSGHAHSTASQYLMQCDYVDSICWIGAQLADALAYAHRHGVVHSDIKPANILMASDGQPRLLDFNVSYRSTSDGIVALDSPLGGTIPYMAPEHRRALNHQGRVDARSDIYSLGVVLFQMLTGRLPDRNADTSDSPVWNPAVSPAMSAIVRKCLAADPESRYSSADALRDDLSAQYHHEPLVHQPEPSQVERLLKWSRRHPRISSSLSIATGAAIVFAFLITGLLLRQNALNQADWVHRMDMLRQSIPISMAMLTSLDAVPDLEAATSEHLRQTFAHVESTGSPPHRADVRWSNRDLVDDVLRSDLQLLAMLAKQQKWSVPLSVPDGLDLANQEHGVQEDSSPNAQTQIVLELLRAGEFPAAVRHLNDRIEKNPRDYVGWWLLGDSSHASQDHAAAIQAYTVCIALQPSTPIAYLNRGMAYYSSNAFDAASRDYGKVVQLAPTWNPARFNRALALQKMGRVDEAISELDKAIQNGFENVSLFRLRAQLMEAKGDREAAMADYAQALQCEPKTEQHWIDRGLIRLGINPVQAAEDFQLALAANPNSIEAHQKLAYVYAELLRDPEKSLQHSNQLVNLAPHQLTHLAGRSVLHARAGRTKEAIEDLSKLESKRIADPMVMYQAACICSLLAADYSQREQDATPFREKSIGWFTRAVEKDRAILEVAMTDLDVQWMRGQPAFQQILRAIKTLDRKPE
jgi:serine/threonine protein kinase/Flp pilus assembly protein TadD